ncbi:MAG: hypothetical protein AAGJ28_09935 [Pseudomonadota bacterium]
MTKYILTGLIALMLFACGPQFKTERTYIPPETIEGRTCVATCDTAQQVCRGRADDEDRFCRAQERERKDDERACRARNAALPDLIQTANGPVKPKKENCFKGTKQFCRADYRECTRDHDACYQRCGGQVVKRKVCVANCGG